MAVAGCVPGEERASVPGARDSAGIQIIENSDFVWPEGRGWYVAEEPTLDIGVADGDSVYQFYRVRSAAKLRDGRVVVANGGTHELRYYDAYGTYLNTSGRDGGGPGEFHSLTAAYRLPRDSLLTYDLRLQRLSVFDPSGRFAGSTNISGLIGRYAVLITLGRLDDGSLLVWIRDHAARPMGDGAISDSALYYRISRDGAVLDSLGLFKRSESYVYRHDGGAVMGDLPFGRQPSTAVHSSGFYHSDGEAWEVRDYAPDGTLRRLIRRESPARPLTADDIAAAREDQLADETTEGGRRFVNRMFDESEFPKTLPCFRSLRVDSEGNLWASEFRRPGDDQPRYVVFDPDGVMLGIVETPKGLGITEVGADYVLGRWVDEVGVEYVRLYPLIKN